MGLFLIIVLIPQAAKGVSNIGDAILDTLHAI